jgi:Fis family transcriptional regulator
MNAAIRPASAGKTDQEQWHGLRVLQSDRSEPLRECVRSALRYYLQKMDGHDVSDLYRMVLDEVERPLIQTVLENANDNQTVAARMLGISRGTLRKKLKELEQR